MRIKYNPPINIKGGLLKLFKPDYKYLNVKLKVRKFNNVFVNHFGLVLNRGVLVKGCAPNIGLSFYDKSFLFKHWRNSFEQMIVSKYGKSIPYESWDDTNQYLLIHSPWFSYYFWITECIPRLLKVKDNLDNLILIYPESWKDFSFVNETLELFPNLRKKVLKNDIHLRVKNLVLPEVKPWTPMFIPEDILAVRDLILGHAIEKRLESPAKGNIYISRKDSKRKNFENNSEVSQLLKKYNFSELTFSGLTIFEQALLMYNAKNVVSITGAGMSNFMFLKENSKVLDVTNIKYIKTKKYKFHFWKLTNIIGVKYYVQFCEHTNHPDVPRYSLQNLIPDLSKMEEIIKLMDDGKVE